MTHHASWVSTFAHLKTEEHHIAADERKTHSLFLYYGSILSHQEVWLLLLDVLMKATGNQVVWTRSFIFIKRSHFFGLHGDGEEQTICGAHNGIISATFRRITTWFIGQHSALRSFYSMHGTSSTHWYQSSQRLLLCESKIIKAFILPHLLRNTYLDVRPDLVIVWALLRCLSISLHSDIRVICQRMQRKIRFWLTMALLRIILHTCSLLFFGSLVSWIWIDRLNEMMISVNRACVWGPRLTTSDNVSAHQKAHYSRQFQYIHYLQCFFIPTLILCVKGVVWLYCSQLK